MAVSIVAFIVLGSVLEGIPAIVLFGPLLFPIARAVGIHEVHYAMVVILAMGIGLFAPPFGVGYYAACAIGRVDPGRGHAADLGLSAGAAGRPDRGGDLPVDFDRIPVARHRNRRWPMSGKQNQYNIGLDKTPANFVPLTPLSFLARSAAVYPDHVSAVYEGRIFTWSQTYARCRRFASYLAGRNIGSGDTVAAMLPNIPAMNELHFAVPMAGAVLNALNIRLDASSIAFQLDHGGAKIILVDPEFSGVIAEALDADEGPKAVRHRRRRRGVCRRQADRRDRI